MKPEICWILTNKGSGSPARRAVDCKFERSVSREKQEKIEEKSRELICKITPNIQEISNTSLE